MLNITQDMMGPDGKIEVYDLHLMKYKRVAAVDAREQFDQKIIVLKEPSDVEMKGPAGLVTVKWHDVDNMKSKGYEIFTRGEKGSKTDPTTSGSGASSSETSTGGGSGGGEGDNGNESAQPFDFTKFDVDKLRGFGVRAGIANARSMKRSDLLEALPKSGYNPDKDTE